MANKRSGQSLRWAENCFAGIQAIGLTLASWTAIAVPSFAQTAYPVCQPPQASEYILLVSARTPEEQARVQSVLPQNASTLVCDYLDNVVMRVGGFASLDIANSWATYLSDIANVSAFVVRPATTEVIPAPAVNVPTPSPNPAAIAPQPVVAATTPIQPATTPPVQPTATTARTAVVTPTPPAQSVPATTPTPSPAPAAPTPRAQPATTTPTQPARTATAPGRYDPQLLQSGYAVLVDYANKPEVAGQIRQTLSRDIGLVSYGQRPYLLAAYTPNQTEANTVLRTLSEQGFTSMIVVLNSRPAWLLRQSVR